MISRPKKMNMLIVVLVISFLCGNQKLASFDASSVSVHARISKFIISEVVKIVEFKEEQFEE